MPSKVSFIDIILQQFSFIEKFFENMYHYNTMFNKKRKHRKTLYLLQGILAAITFFAGSTLTVMADTDYQAAAQERKNLPIQTNDISGWPEGPQIGAEAAILMDVTTGTILYAKNIHEQI